MAASTVQGMGMRSESLVFVAVAALQLLFGSRAFVQTSGEHDIALIFELLSRRTCPAGVILCLRLAACSLPAAAGSALALSRVSSAAPHAHNGLRYALMGHAACGLEAASGKLRLGPSVQRAQLPTAVHGLALAACAPGACRAVHRSRPGATTSQVATASPRLAPGARVARAVAALGGAVALAPGAVAASSLHCAGQSLEQAASGVRLVGAGLVSLGLGAAELHDPRLGAPLPLALSVVLGGLAQAAIACCGAHAHGLRWWARGALALAGCTCAVSSTAAFLRHGWRGRGERRSRGRETRD